MSAYFTAGDYAYSCALSYINDLMYMLEGEPFPPHSVCNYGPCRGCPMKA